MANTNNKMKAIAYCRVSSKEQEETGYSLDAQEKLLTDYAPTKGFDVVKIYRVTESASKWQIRKTLNEMLAYAEKHGINIILVEKIDRLTRSMKDAGIVDDWVHGNDSREVHFVKEHFILNSHTKAHESFVWDMKVAVARFYTNNLSEEVRKGQVQKIAKGWLPTKPPLGYKTIGEKGHKTHVVDERVAPFIRQMFELYATGNYSLARLWKELYERGLRSRSGRKLPLSRIHILLSDPFYYGAMRWKGEEHPAIHEPIIDKDLFQKVQTLLKRKIQSPHFRTHNSVYKSKMFCENCNGMLTWELQKGHWYGHCNNHGERGRCPGKTYLRQEDVEIQMFTFFQEIAPKTHGMLEWIRDIIKSEYAQNVEEREGQLQRIESHLVQLRARKDRLYDDKLDEVISLEVYKQKFAEYSEQEKDLSDARAKLVDKSDEYQQLGVALHELAFRAEEIYDKATTEEKRILLSEIFTNLTQNRRTIKPNYTMAGQYLAFWMPKLNVAYEPQTTQINTGLNGHSDSNTSTLLPG